ncbi:hypothetical protein [Verrucomicrobium sp. BvORR034]|uniref:hypothetical protein n=1 Tax=Verrucomicrobium sp. BvORR034 TaxID=1396418 RepID=UPI0006791289|nr:hypothetical protein [Verrucomicrobium sp. BvORR034]
MNSFVDLARRFRIVNETELEASDDLAQLNEPSMYESYLSLGWEELLCRARVLLLATAGAGKTREMQERSKALNSNGQFCLFIPLEQLGQEDLPSILSPPENKRFDQWLNDESEEGWFFLDSVDELKLTRGTFKRALQRLKNALGAELNRSHILISSRPHDWRLHHDSALVQEYLPFEPPKKKNTLSAEELFLQAFDKEKSHQTDQRNAEIKGKAALPAMTIVTLLPLSNRQIETLTLSKGIEDAKDFLDTIRKRNAWLFARQPLDLLELISFWKTKRRLGTRAEQHALNLSSRLRDNPERADRGVLSDDKAMQGAQRLALALTLSHCRTIKSPEQVLELNVSETAIDASAILTDWTEEERQTLLRRPLFDPATYGRIRFHHRSIQEYLAAQRLANLRDRGMPTNAIFRLLFSNRYGFELVVPSMRAIASWHSLSNESVRQKVLKLEPELLLTQGDPESLTVESRKLLVEALVVFYGRGGWRGLGIQIDTVQRLAHIGLDSTVYKCWQRTTQNNEVQSLLLELIWLSPLEGCMDIAESVATSDGFAPSLRGVAMRALASSTEIARIRRTALNMLGNPSSWPTQLVADALNNIFPKHLSLDRLFELLGRDAHTEKDAEQLSWSLSTIVEVFSTTEILTTFIERLADLVLRGRSPHSEYYRMSGKLNSYSIGLASACLKYLELNAHHVGQSILRACIVAHRFHNDPHSRAEVDNLKKFFQSASEYREAAFLAELSLMDELYPKSDSWMRFHQVEQNTILDKFEDGDSEWLERRVCSGCREYSIVAVEALLWLWRSRGRKHDQAIQLQKLVSGFEDLEALVNKSIIPPVKDRKMERLERNAKRRQALHQLRNDRAIDEWRAWRQKVMTDPCIFFSTEKTGNSIALLYAWLAKSQDSSTRYNVWNRNLLIEAFGQNVADYASTAFQWYWRQTSPEMWSGRAKEDRNSTQYVWIYGMCGVSAESEKAGWATKLNSSEAILAAKLAMVEINSFSNFLDELAQNHPSTVESVLGSEIRDQIVSAASTEHLPALQNLTSASNALKILLAPRLLEILQTFSLDFYEQNDTHWSHVLDQMLGILDEGIPTCQRVLVADQCQLRSELGLAAGTAMVFLRGLFRFDPVRGVEAIEKLLTHCDGADASRVAIKAFGTVFARTDGVALIVEAPELRVELLGRMLRKIYAFVRPEDDHVHTGGYTPDIRDHAQEARGYLLGALIETPGIKSSEMLRELASESAFRHIPDRLRHLARERAAKDSEFDAFRPEDVQMFEARYERATFDRDSLFNTVIDRLDDIQHDISHHDFTDRSILTALSDEEDMQRALAAKFADRAKSVYITVREEEVADRKKTDIRLHSVRGEVRSVIEVKIADSRWSIRDLEKALRVQLVKQYLRHKLCSSGCLLLTYNGSKKFWIEPGSRRKLAFAEVVLRLQGIAMALEEDMKHAVRIAVYGLDLTPPLATGK